MEDSEAAVIGAAQRAKQKKKAIEEEIAKPKDIDIDFKDEKDEDLIRGQSLRKPVKAIEDAVAPPRVAKKKPARPPPEFKDDSDDDNPRYVPRAQRKQAAEEAASKSLNEMAEVAKKKAKLKAAASY